MNIQQIVNPRARRGYAFLAALFTVLVLAQLTIAGPTATIYKSPTWGCCVAWVGHLREHGYNIQTKELSDSQLESIKDKYGVPQSLRTCHTAIVEGYVIEGHVPAELIQRLLKEKPAFAGLGVPGMPIGSPGMYGPKPQPYDVFSFDKKGRVTLYKRMPPS